MDLYRCVQADVAALRQADVRVTVGDATCIARGHVSRLVIQALQADWRSDLPVAERLDRARQKMEEILVAQEVRQMVEQVVGSTATSPLQLTLPGTNTDV
jgi:hypothetical protein